MRLGHVQANFTAGEVSARMLGRTDLTRYQNGLFELTNALVQVHGDITRRPGTKWVAHARGDRAARLIPFQFSVTQTYVVEFTASGSTGWCRFFRDAGQVQWSNSAATGPTVTSATFSGSTITYNISAGHLFEVNDRITTAGFTPSGYNQTDAIVTAVTATSVDITAADPGVSPASVDGTIDGPYTITSPFIATTDPGRLKYTQSADILYLTHQDYQPREMQRTGVDQFVFATYDFEDGPYLAINDEAANTINTTNLVNTGAGKVVAGAGTILVPGNATNVGQVIRFQDGTTQDWGWGYIDGVTDTNDFTVDVQVAITNLDTAEVDWRVGAWGADEGWPEAVTFHQQRLWFANTPQKPQTIWGSVSADFVNHAPTELADGVVADDSGMAFTLDDDQVNAIYSLVSTARGLVIMTEGGEFLMQSTSSSDAITPSNVGVRRQTRHGMRRYVKPVPVSSSVLFSQKAGRKIRAFAYFFEDDQFKAPDLAILSEHITKDRIRWMEYQQEPDSILWMIDEAGGLLSLTYERSEEVLGWARHVIGGTDVKALSMASIFENNVDRLWIVVERTVDSATVRFVEYITDEFDASTAIEDAFFVDAGVTYSGGAATVITGLNHLEGEVVDVLTDGAAHPQVTVDSGRITLQVAATKVHAGLPYVLQGQSLPLFALRAPFETRGRNIQCYKVLMNFYRTVGARAGPDVDNLDNVAFREGSDPMDQPVDPFTGVFEADLDSRYDHVPLVMFQQDQPLPFTLLSMIYRLDVNEP
jgi:hypothetical protein